MSSTDVDLLFLLYIYDHLFPVVCRGICVSILSRTICFIQSYRIYPVLSALFSAIGFIQSYRLYPVLGTGPSTNFVRLLVRILYGASRMDSEWVNDLHTLKKLSQKVYTNLKNSIRGLTRSLSGYIEVIINLF